MSIVFTVLALIIYSQIQKNHRNYFSHLNENKRKILFNGFQLNYAYWKIVITYRLILIKYLGVPYNEKLLDKIISEINEYKKNNLLKLSRYSIIDNNWRINVEK